MPPSDAPSSRPSADPAPRDRAAEVARVLDQVTRWAAGRSDVAGLLLVGSRARGASRPDSDLDLVLLGTDDEDGIVADCARELGFGGPIRVQPWGAVTEHRFVTSSGLEVELDLAAAGWARVDPVDPGTVRVVPDGARILYDPSGLLTVLVAACLR